MGLSIAESGGFGAPPHSVGYCASTQQRVPLLGCHSFHNWATLAGLFMVRQKKQ
jgi:hypothetical protein